MIEDDKHARRVARAVLDHRRAIMTALEEYGRSLDEQVEQAKAQYQSGQDNIEVMKAQDNSHVTNWGWQKIAEARFVQSLTMYTAAEALRVALDNDDAP